MLTLMTQIPSTLKEGLAASGKEYYILLQLVHNERHNSIHPIVL
jgi:hypothetical protein